MSHLIMRRLIIPFHRKNDEVWLELFDQYPRSAERFFQKFAHLKQWIWLEGLTLSHFNALQKVFEACCHGFSFLFQDEGDRKVILLLEDSPQRWELLFVALEKSELSDLGKELRQAWVPLTTPPLAWDFGDRQLSFEEGQSYIMGIVNVTPDSFSDGGHFLASEQAVAHALKLFEDGATIVDIGGESTRPQADFVPVEEEIKRVIPVIEGIKRYKKDALISIDTRKKEVAEAALEAGAKIVNDVSMLRFDPHLAKLVAAHDAFLILMHSRQSPKNMQEAPYYRILWQEICAELKKSLQLAVELGVAREKIAIDPGIGFGKRFQDNCRILREFSILNSFGLPLVIGTSRKSFIGQVLDSPAHDRLEGSLATIAIARQYGAHILRVHDVLETRRFLDMLDAIWRPSIR